MRQKDKETCVDLAGLAVTVALPFFMGLGGLALGVVLWALGHKAFKELTLADRVDMSRWVCPHCDAIFRKDAVQLEMAKRRREQRDDAVSIFGAPRMPDCPRCAKPLDGQKFLDGLYDLPMIRYRQLKKQGALP